MRIDTLKSCILQCEIMEHEEIQRGNRKMASKLTMRLAKMRLELRLRRRAEI